MATLFRTSVGENDYKNLEEIKQASTISRNWPRFVSFYARSEKKNSTGGGGGAVSPPPDLPPARHSKSVSFWGSILVRFSWVFWPPKTTKIRFCSDAHFHTQILWFLCKQVLAWWCMRSMKIVIFIWFLQWFWAIRSLRTCVNLDIRALPKYFRFQVKNPCKIVWNQCRQPTTFPFNFFIVFGTQNTPENGSKNK